MKKIYYDKEKEEKNKKEEMEEVDEVKERGRRKSWSCKKKINRKR